ncbi:MAG TPA: SRPBCC family protein [Mycobacteriales bacterium]|nr:SRPBCC family protein [Mycobacteriales bacterium]
MTRSMFEARTLAVSVRRPPEVVYAYAADPRNLPAWSFIESVEPAGDRWLARTSAGPVLLRFAAPNTLGVLDHDVELAPGKVLRVPMRVIANGDGSEVLFTLFRQPGTSAAAFEQDARTVGEDLAALKAVLERAAATNVG